MHTHSAPPAKRFQKIVEPALTQRHSDALTSVVRSSGDVFCRYIKTRRTTTPPKNEQQHKALGGGGGGLNSFNWYQIFAIYFDVIV